LRIEDAAWTSSVSTKKEAPVVVDVESRKLSKIPVSRSSLISVVQLYRPICDSGGPLVLGKLITVGLALGLALVDAEADIGLKELAKDDPSARTVDCDASWRRSKARLLSGTAVESGIFALTVSVDATTRDPELVDTASSAPSSSGPGCSTGQRLQLD
jgi:hypothetical protein